MFYTVSIINCDIFVTETNCVIFVYRDKLVIRYSVQYRYVLWNNNINEYDQDDLSVFLYSN